MNGSVSLALIAADLPGNYSLCNGVGIIHAEVLARYTFRFDQGLSRVDEDVYEFRSVCGLFGMYGPPPFCKRKVRMTELACANVFGLD